MPPLLLAAAASVFAVQFPHMVARALAPASDACDAQPSLSSFHAPSSARVLIAQHCTTCSEAGRRLCRAWAVSAAPLLLSQVRCSRG
jgi:hypothetical protein